MLSIHLRHYSNEFGKGSGKKFATMIEDEPCFPSARLSAWMRTHLLYVIYDENIKHTLL